MYIYINYKTLSNLRRCNKHVHIGSLCNFNIFDIFQFIETCANAACMKIFLHASIERSIKILRKKTKMFRTVNLCKKYIRMYKCPLCMSIGKFCICVCVCVYVEVRFVCSFVFSVLSVDCWRPWQQLTWLMRRRIVVLKCVLVARRFSRQ